GGVVQTSIDACRARLFFDPFVQSVLYLASFVITPFPAADQALVRNVYQGIGVERHARGRRQERAARRAELFDDGDDFSGTGFGDGADFANRDGATGFAIVHAFFSQRLEHLFGDLLAALT